MQINYIIDIDCTTNNKIIVFIKNYRACLITLHSNFEIFQKGHPAVESNLDRRIFER